jgi:hypothetical protein
MSDKKNVTIRTVENRPALLIKAAIAIVFTYAFASFAIDSGSYWHYLFTFISLAIAVHVISRLIKDYIRNHGSKKKK